MGFKLTEYVTKANWPTVLILAGAIITFPVTWYWGTKHTLEAFAESQKRQDADITKNATQTKVNERDITESKIKFRGLETRVDTQFNAIQHNQDAINEKLDRLIDIQLRGVRAR